MIKKMTTIYAIILFAVVPLVVTPFFNEPYFRGKIILTILITGLFLLYLVFSQRQFIMEKLQDSSWLRLKGHEVEWTVVVMFVLVSLSMVLSEDYWLSFFGQRSAPEGYVSLCLYFAIFMIFYKLPFDVLKVQELALIAGVICGSIAALEFVKVIPYFSQNIYDYEFFNNFLSTIGNRNFMGTYGVILFGLSLSKVLNDSGFRGYVYTTFYFGLIMMTETRSAYLAAGIMILAVLAMSYRNKHYMMKIKTLLVLIGGLVCFGVLYQMIGQKDFRIVNRMMSMLYDMVHFFDDNAGTRRIGIWRDTVSFLFASPVFGAGPDAFGLAYREHVGYLTGTLYDKAHNEWLNMIVTLGVPYFVLYISLIVRSFRSALGKMVDEPKFMAVILVVIGYTAQSQFNISVFTTGVMYLAVLGVGLREIEG